MTRIIEMTAEQTAVYDGDDAGAVALMTDLRAKARTMGGAVEIYTADGIVADFVQG